MRIPNSDAQGIDQRITTAETALTNANSNTVIQTLFLKLTDLEKYIDWCKKMNTLVREAVLR